MMNKKTVIIAAAIIALAAAIIFINRNSNKGISGIGGGIKIGNGAIAGKYDAFVKCLADKGVKLYGAYWCPHCQEQKKMFGDSFKYVNYIECTAEGSNKQNEVCVAAGISGYPTWIFADGRKESGAKSLEELSKISGCAL